MIVLLANHSSSYLFILVKYVSTPNIQSIERKNHDLAVMRTQVTWCNGDCFD